ncbi:MAG TPA: hypothetical protein VHM01_04965, partial [Alphaproteobacteria bacterium]|nr:hypothetical protein [Alphaproteobacteria bacterium]
SLDISDPHQRMVASYRLIAQKGCSASAPTPAAMARAASTIAIRKAGPRPLSFAGGGMTVRG